MGENDDTGERRSMMSRALAAAEAAARAGEVPVGAVITGADGVILAIAGNEVEAAADPTAHAEILAIRRAARRLGAARLEGCTIHVTLEPCAMCAQAIAHARIARLVFGAYDPKGGGVEHGAEVFRRATCHHRPEVTGGVEESRAVALLRKFFEERR